MIRSDHTHFLTSTNLSSRDAPPTPIKFSELPPSPWYEISLDFYEPLPSGDKLFVLTDLYSRFPLIEFMKSTATQSVTNRLENIFRILVIRTDNGPPFFSEEFKE